LVTPTNWLPIGTNAGRRWLNLDAEQALQAVSGDDRDYQEPDQGDVRNGFDGIKVTYHVDADATPDEIRALVAQSQKRSAVFDIITNPTNVTVEVA
jgi:uncharacterized OsmC-like protein